MAFAVEQQPASPAGPQERPGFIARGRIRRRIRFLRKARELAYRDLGGLVFNLHRFGQRNDALVLAKLTTLGTHRLRAARAGDHAARAPAADGAERGGDHRLCTLRRDPLQRGPLLPQLRPAVAPPRRPAGRPPHGRHIPGAGPGRRVRRPGAERLPAHPRSAGATGAGARRTGRRLPDPDARRHDAGAGHTRHTLTCSGHAHGRLTLAGHAPCGRAPCGRARERHPGGRRSRARAARPRRAGRRRSHGDRAPAGEPAVSWPGQPAAASATPAGAEPSVSPVGSVGPTGAAPAEACPLCGSPLQTDQDWCLYCGAAAHTRLSATPNWKAPLAVAIVVAALLLGVLAAALVKLARGPGPAPPAATTVITAPAVAGTTTPGTTTPARRHPARPRPVRPRPEPQLRGRRPRPDRRAKRAPAQAPVARAPPAPPAGPPLPGPRATARPHRERRPRLAESDGYGCGR